MTGCTESAPDDGAKNRHRPPLTSQRRARRARRGPALVSRSTSWRRGRRAHRARGRRRGSGRRPRSRSSQARRDRRGALGNSLAQRSRRGEILDVTREGDQVDVDVSEPFGADGGALACVCAWLNSRTRSPVCQTLRASFSRSEGRRVQMVGEGLEIENPLVREDYSGVVPKVLIESPLPGDEVGSPMIASGAARCRARTSY